MLVSKAVSKRTAKPKIKPALSVYVLLDRSGSMSDRWGEALSSINSYVRELKASSAAVVTLATFDTHVSSYLAKDENPFKFEVIRNGVSASRWNPVTVSEVKPRGGTPLYDAFGRIVELADTRNAERTIIVVMTDGQNNASVSLSAYDAKRLVNQCQAKDWQVVFLGAEFDAREQAAVIGVGYANTLNMARGFYGSATQTLSGLSAQYAATGATMGFTDEDRAKAGSFAGNPK